VRKIHLLKAEVKSELLPRIRERRVICGRQEETVKNEPGLRGEFAVPPRMACNLIGSSDSHCGRSPHFVSEISKYLAERIIALPTTWERKWWGQSDESAKLEAAGLELCSLRQPMAS
jgi:hypothetical protein